MVRHSWFLYLWLVFWFWCSDWEKKEISRIMTVDQERRLQYWICSLSGSMKLCCSATCWNTFWELQQFKQWKYLNTYLIYHLSSESVLQSIQQSEDVSICLNYITEVQALTQLCEVSQATQKSVVISIHNESDLLLETVAFILIWPCISWSIEFSYIFEFECVRGKCPLLEAENHQDICLWLWYCMPKHVRLSQGRFYYLLPLYFIVLVL